MTNEEIFNNYLTKVLTPIVERAVKNCINLNNTETSTTKKYLTVGELAELTGYSKSTIYQKSCWNQIPGAHKIGNRLLFEYVIINNWITNNIRHNG